MNAVFSLMYDETSGSVAEATVKYGVYLVVASLVPAIIAVVHVTVSGEEEAGNQGRGSQLWLGAGIVLSVLLFPFVPIYFYIKLLITSNHVNLEEEKAQKVVYVPYSNLNVLSWKLHQRKDNWDSYHNNLEEWVESPWSKIC